MTTPTTITIDSIRYVREDSLPQAASFAVPETGVPFEIGKAYLIRTVTMTLTGRVTAIIGSFLVLEDAAWIADTGRFTECIKDGTVNECEPVAVPVRVSMPSIVDAYDWTHPLPRSIK